MVKKLCIFVFLWCNNSNIRSEHNLICTIIFMLRTNYLVRLYFKEVHSTFDNHLSHKESKPECWYHLLASMKQLGMQYSRTIFTTLTVLMVRFIFIRFEFSNYDSQHLCFRLDGDSVGRTMQACCIHDSRFSDNIPNIIIQ